MKKLLFIAALAATLTSCGIDSKDSYSSVNFLEYNLITDLENASEPAQVAPAVYNLKLNYSKNTMDVTASGLTAGNDKISFETTPMPFTAYYLGSSDGSSSFTEYRFSSTSNVGNGAEVTNLSATVTPGVYNFSGLYIPGFESTQYSFGSRLLMGYDLNGKYHVQTFWTTCYYAGQSYVSGGGTSYSTKDTGYRVDLDFEKKTAKVAVIYPKLSEENTDVPNAIVMENVPILFSHNCYYLAAESPKTTVLGVKDNVQALVESERFNVTDFRMDITNGDLTEVSINYRIDNKAVNFEGLSVIKATIQN